MAIRHLQVNHFRNIRQAEISPSDGVNYIFGLNGSGKTSLLEAIYCLSRARSFRTNLTNQLISKGEEAFSVIARALHQGRDTTIGFKRTRGNSEIHLGGKVVSRAGDLAAVLPVSVLDTRLHAFIEDGPEIRRKFLDWGVFHVEPNFRSVWYRFKRALMQRNAALKAGWSKQAINQWDQELVGPALELDNMRRDYLQQLESSVASTARGFQGLEPVSLNYIQGWREGDVYREYLHKQLESDRERGFTQFGPQRADIRIQTEKGLAREIFSRGQQKLCAAVLALAQCHRLSLTGKQVILLVDDLAAELDEENRVALLSSLEQSGSQVFITGTDENLYQQRRTENGVFHVKQGQIQQC